MTPEQKLAAVHQLASELLDAFHGYASFDMQCMAAGDRLVQILALTRTDNSVLE